MIETKIVVDKGTAKCLDAIKRNIITCKAIAIECNTGPESVARVLRIAKKKGLITTSRKRVDNNMAYYLVYSLVEGIAYKVANRKSGPGNVPLNKYEENMYPQLDAYIYRFPPRNSS